MKTRFSFAALLLYGLFAVSTKLSECHAQLVADSTTASINASSTNITGDLIVGTNGSFTTLVVTNGGAVTNSGNGILGQGFNSRTNRVVVTEANSRWSMGGNLNLGVTGSFNLLLVTNGGWVEDLNGIVSSSANSTGNTALVTGSSSLWTNRSGLNIGSGGPFNRVIVTNGGTVTCGQILYVGVSSASNQMTVSAGSKVFTPTMRMGYDAPSVGNLAVLADSGSQWTVSSGVEMGASGHFNQLFVTNGAKMFAGGLYVGDQFIGGGTGVGNLVMISGTGSTWTNTYNAKVGFSGSSNQLVIANSGVLQNLGGDSSVTVGFASSSSNNLMLVGGNNSLFSNLRGGNPQTIIGFIGSFNQLLVTNGGVVETGSGFLGYASGSSNNTALIRDPGSNWTNSDALYIGYGGSSNTLFLSNSGTAATTSLFIGFDPASSNNTAIISGGNVIVTNDGTGITDVRQGKLMLNAGLLLTDGLYATNGAQSQLALNGGTVQTRGTLVSNGSSVLAGDGISPLTLELLGNGTHTFGNGLVIASNALLKGNGTIIGNVTNANGGTLSPGSSIGQITMTGILNLAAGSTNVFEINKSSLTNDTIAGLTSVIYGGSLVVANLAGTLASGDSFKLFSSTSYSGSFNSLSLPALGTGLVWKNNLLFDGTIQVNSTASIQIKGAMITSGGAFQLSFTNTPGTSYSVVASTNISLPLSNWTNLGNVAETSPGQFQFTDSQTTNFPQRFYRVTSP